MKVDKSYNELNSELKELRDYLRKTDRYYWPQSKVERIYEITLMMNKMADSVPRTTFNFKVTIYLFNLK